MVHLFTNVQVSKQTIQKNPTEIRIKVEEINFADFRTVYKTVWYCHKDIHSSEQTMTFSSKGTEHN